MKIRDHLNEQQRKKQEQKKGKKKDEKIDWDEMMGIHRDIYKRGRGGAIRRK